MKLSVIVINYKSREILTRCLASIHSRYSHEIIVVDNDNDLPKINIAGVQIIPYTINLGFCGANNKAMAIAQGEYILYLNADAFLTEDYIDNCLHFLDKHPECASVQGKLLKERDHHLIDSTGNVLTRSFWAFNEHHLHPDHTIPSHEIFGVCCAAGIFRRSALEEVEVDNKVFDETFFAYLEDVDLNIRLRNAGYSAWYVSEAIAYHIRESSTRFLYRFIQSLKNKNILECKHRGVGVKQRLLLWLFHLRHTHRPSPQLHDNTDPKSIKQGKMYRMHLNKDAEFYTHVWTRLKMMMTR